MFTDRGFNKIYKLRRGTKAGEFHVISQRSRVFGLWYYRLEQVFGDGFIFLNLFIDPEAVAAFIHLRLLHSFSKKPLNSLQKLSGSGPVALSVCQSLSWCASCTCWHQLHIVCIIFFMLDFWKLNTSAFQTNEVKNEAAQVTGSSGGLF